MAADEGPDRIVTVAPAAELGDPELERTTKARRVLYGLTSLALALLVGLAVADGLDVVDVYGVDTAVVTAASGDRHLSVRHATVTRPGLATPFDITVTQPGGFDEPVTVAVRQAYLDRWDENGVRPAPASETTLGDWLVWEFDPPDGDTLVVHYDGRIEPAVQRSFEGAVALLDDSTAVARVAFRTRVLP